MGMSHKEYDTILYCDLVLKLEGYKDRLLHEEKIQRLVAYSSYIAPHLNPKKMATNIGKFWHIEEVGKADGKKVSDEKRAAIKQAIAERKAAEKQLQENGS